MARDLIVNGVTYPEVESLNMTDADGEEIAYLELPQLSNPGAAEHLLEGTQLIDGGGAVVPGSMANNGAVHITMDGLTTTSVSIPAGCHNGDGTVSLTDDIEKALAAI